MDNYYFFEQVKDIYKYRKTFIGGMSNKFFLRRATYTCNIWLAETSECFFFCELCGHLVVFHLDEFEQIKDDGSVYHGHTGPLLIGHCACKQFLFSVIEKRLAGTVGHFGEVYSILNSTIN